MGMLRPAPAVVNILEGALRREIIMQTPCFSSNPGHNAGSFVLISKAEIPLMGVESSPWDGTSEKPGSRPGIPSHTEESQADGRGRQPGQHACLAVVLLG